MYAHGWFKLGFVDDFTETLSPAQIGDRRLLVVREGDTVRVYGANCPHRGAHLAYGGRLDGCAVVCPFHGYRIGLSNSDTPHGFAVPEHRSVVLDGLIFVRLSATHDNGFEAYIRELNETHTFVPGFHLPMNCPASLVIENGFDNRHFPAVHGILNNPKFTVTTTETGSVTVQGEFDVPYTGNTPYEAHTFSPGLIVVHLTGKTPYSVITGAMPLSAETCIIHLSLALSKEHHGPTPNAQMVKHVLHHSRRGLEEDRIMWENLVPIDPPLLTKQDEAILDFQAFCAQFETEKVPA